MSMPSNEEIIRSSYDAFHRGDIDAALASFAPDIEWTHPDGMADRGLGGTVKGHQEVRAFMARARAVFSELRPAPKEFVASGDRVAVFGTHHMRGAPGGTAGTVEFVHSWRLRDGKATHFRDFHDTAEVRRLLNGSGAAGEPEDDGSESIIELARGYRVSSVLFSAVDLGVFSALAGRELDTGELCAAADIHDSCGPDLFDTLVALGLLERTDGRYRNSHAAETFLDRAKPDTYLGPFFELCKLEFQAIGHLTDALSSGQDQLGFGGSSNNPFASFYSEPDKADMFQRAMTNIAARGNAEIGERFPWEKYRTVADIGCSEGPLLVEVLDKHPHLTGVGFDLPAVAPMFAEMITKHGLSDRVTFTAGSFFTDPMPSADVLVLGHILHSWDEPTKLTLLRKAYDALPDGGALLIHEALIDDERRHNASALLTSLQMHVVTGGSDYTAAECRRWLTHTGFRDIWVQRLTQREWMITANK